MATVPRVMRARGRFYSTTEAYYNTGDAHYSTKRRALFKVSGCYYNVSSLFYYGLNASALTTCAVCVCREGTGLSHLHQYHQAQRCSRSSIILKHETCFKTWHQRHQIIIVSIQRCLLLNSTAYVINEHRYSNVSQSCLSGDLAP